MFVTLLCMDYNDQVYDYNSDQTFRISSDNEKITITEILFRNFNLPDNEHIVSVTDQAEYLKVVSSTFFQNTGEGFAPSLYTSVSTTLNKVCVSQCSSKKSDSFMLQREKTIDIDFLSVIQCSNDYKDNTTVDTEYTDMQYSNVSNNKCRLSAFNAINPITDIKYCEFMYNKHQTQALFISGHDIKVISCIFLGNNGYGVLCEDSSNIKFRDCYFVDNSNLDIKAENSSVELELCNFKNDLKTSGSGIIIGSRNRKGSGNVPDPISNNPNWGYKDSLCGYLTFPPPTWSKIIPADCLLNNEEINQRKRYKRLTIIFSLSSTFF